MANLYTKTGDMGRTSLIGGTRVSKAHLRVECCGDIDEASSALGLAKSLSKREYVRQTVHKIQGTLFSLGAELACDQGAVADLKWKLTDEDLTYLEGVADHCMEICGAQTQFVVPGVDPASAALHVARTVVRRAERAVVRVSEAGEGPGELVMCYINRLSDAIYALARLEETLAQREVERKQAEEESPAKGQGGDPVPL